MCGDSGIIDTKSQNVVCAVCGLRDLAIGLGLGGVDQVGELDAVTDEEHRDVVADQIEHALVGVELHREATDVAHGVGRAPRAHHGREPREHRRRHARLQEAGARDLARRAVRLEHAVGSRTACVHHALGDALVVEVHDLLAEMEVVHQRRAPHTGLQRVVRVRQAHTEAGREEVAVLRGDLARPRREHRCIRLAHGPTLPRPAGLACSPRPSAAIRSCVLPSMCASCGEQAHYPGSAVGQTRTFVCAGGEDRDDVLERGGCSAELALAVVALDDPPHHRGAQELERFRLAERGELAGRPPEGRERAERAVLQLAAPFEQRAELGMEACLAGTESMNGVSPGQRRSSSAQLSTIRSIASTTRSAARMPSFAFDHTSGAVASNTPV